MRREVCLIFGCYFPVLFVYSHRCCNFWVISMLFFVFQRPITMRGLIRYRTANIILSYGQILLLLNAYIVYILFDLL